MQLRGPIVLLALLGATACQEAPSYRLSWMIEDRVMGPVSCAETGVLDVRARVYTGGEADDDPVELVDERTFACSPAELREPEPPAGPALLPGRYAIELRGTDRIGMPWDDAAPPDFEPGTASPEGCSPGSIACRPTELVCACQALEVVATNGSPTSDEGTVVEQGDTVDLPTFMLMAPPQCRDGIDNDHDGFVDANDPSCDVAFGDGTEGVPVGVTELQLSLTLLDRNPVVGCASVPLRRVRLQLEGDAPLTVLEEPCQLDQPYLATLRLPAGTATFSVVGLGATGEPVTVTESFDAEVLPTGGTVAVAVDFGTRDFLEPVTDEVRSALGLVSERGTEAEVRYSCEPRELAEGVTRGQLSLAELRVQLLDGHGGPLPDPVALEDGTVLDGPTTLPCRTSLVTEDLVWGSYRWSIEALSSEGEVCFSNAGHPPLVPPGNLHGVFLPRVYDEAGTVPASCHDCETDADCGLDTLRCVGNVCQSLCETDDDCVSPELGDADGFSCLDGACAWTGIVDDGG